MQTTIATTNRSPKRRSTPTCGVGLIAIAIITSLLAGCASRVVSANARSVVVDAGRPPNRSSAEAQRMADAECAKHGRIAQMTARPIYGESTEYVFACVN